MSHGYTRCLPVSTWLCERVGRRKDKHTPLIYLCELSKYADEISKREKISLFFGPCVCANQWDQTALRVCIINDTWKVYIRLFTVFLFLFLFALVSLHYCAECSVSGGALNCCPLRGHQLQWEGEQVTRGRTCLPCNASCVREREREGERSQCKAFSFITISLRENKLKRRTLEKMNGIRSFNQDKWTSPIPLHSRRLVGEDTSRRWVTGVFVHEEEHSRAAGHLETAFLVLRQSKVHRADELINLKHEKGTLYLFAHF